MDRTTTSSRHARLQTLAAHPATTAASRARFERALTHANSTTNRRAA